MALPSLSMIIGGAASGKSAYGEQLVNGADRNKAYIATARIFDDEMRDKVAKHIEYRGDGWRTLETEVDLGAALQTCKADDVVLIDCATMWLTNVMMDELSLDKECTKLLASFKNAPCPIVLVTNEVGHGIVPNNKLARAFREAQGQLNQKIASQADLVVLVTAGLPLALKGNLPQ